MSVENIAICNCGCGEVYQLTPCWQCEEKFNQVDNATITIEVWDEALQRFVPRAEEIPNPESQSNFDLPHDF